MKRNWAQVMMLPLPGSTLRVTKEQWDKRKGRKYTNRKVWWKGINNGQKHYYWASFFGWLEERSGWMDIIVNNNITSRLRINNIHNGLKWKGFFFFLSLSTTYSLRTGPRNSWLSNILHGWVCVQQTLLYLCNAALTWLAAPERPHCCNTQQTPWRLPILPPSCSCKTKKHYF